MGLRESRLQARVIALSERTQQDVAEEQVLHRKRFGDYRHRPRPQDRCDKSPANADLTYAGAAFIGLRGDAWHALHERLQQIAIKRAPLTGLRIKGAQWVKPTITARVRHLAGGNYLRHAVVKRLEQN